MRPSYKFETGVSFARRMDQQDALSLIREKFHIPRTNDGKDAIYLCGNSLGLQPKNVSAFVGAELENWQRLGVKGHFEGEFSWMPYHEFLTPDMSEIVGGEQKEVVVMNSLTVNLHLMLVSFYRPTTDRYKILIEDQAFPSDRFAIRAQIAFHGFDPDSALCLVRPRFGEQVIRDEDICEIIEREGHEIALILLPGVQYYTGQVFDMAEITRLGHQKKCLVGYDLAHAAGNIPLELHDWGADFAVWCTYKYLNSGPGSVGGCFVHARHSVAIDVPRFTGWWGQEKSDRFEMTGPFRPTEGVEGWQISNPPILSLAAIRASLEIFRDAGFMLPLKKKSETLTTYLQWLLKYHLGHEITVVTPEEPHRRGCQLSLIVPGDQPLFDKLDEVGVVCDWRAPDVIRIAPVPLYNSFEDCFRFVKKLKFLLDGNNP